MSCYDFIYKLTPVYECEPGWWKLKWKPIRRGTWHAYRSAPDTFGLGFRTWDESARNGWGRWWRGRHVELTLLWWTFNAWVIWNVRVMAEGPGDVSPRRPLQIPNARGSGSDAEPAQGGPKP